MSAVVFIPSRDALAHLAVALDRHGRELRRAGEHLPVPLAELLASIRATTGQHATEVALVDRWLEDRAVAPLLLTKNEAARALAVSERTVSRLAADGALPAVHVLGSTRFRVEDVERYVAELVDGTYQGVPAPALTRSRTGQPRPGRSVQPRLNQGDNR